MLSETPDVAISTGWELAQTGFELHMRSQTRAAGTIATRLSNFLVMAKWATLHEHEPEQITRERMQQYLNHQYKNRVGRGAINLYQSLRVYWDWFAAEYESPNPMAGIPRPTGTSRPVPVLNPAQIEAVFAACKGSPRDTALVSLFLGSGLRRAELCALDTGDVNLTSRTISVKCGKGGKSRITVMDEQATQAVWKYLKKRPERDGALFTNRFGDRLGLSGCSQILSRAGERAGFRLHPHMFRHAWAHYNLAGGIPEHSLMKLAGWSSTAMLSRYGAALAEERAIEAGRAVQVSQVVRERSKR